MIPYVPTPSSNQDQLVASLAASPPLPSASPTPTPGYSGADPRPQISSSVKHSAQLVESACNVGDLGLIPGLGRSPGDGNDYPLQYSSLENSMLDRVSLLKRSWCRAMWCSTHLVSNEHCPDQREGATLQTGTVCSSLNTVWSQSNNRDLNQHLTQPHHPIIPKGLQYQALTPLPLTHNCTFPICSNIC